MPTYDYECKECGNIQEVKHEMRINHKVLFCKECGSENIRKVISGGSGFILKGTGWYKEKRR